jgi:hypothetical protein
LHSQLVLPVEIFLGMFWLFDLIHEGEDTF